MSTEEGKIEISDYFYKDGKKLFLLGINYHPGEYGLNYYREYAKGDVKVKASIERDFREMKGFGLNSARIFIRLGDFFDPKIRYKSLELFDFFAECAEKNGIYIIPCFYGHMSGENTPKGKFYSDEMTDRAVELMEDLAKNHDSKSILFWDPSNEPLYREIPESHEKAYEWSMRVYNALKSGGKPAIMGEGSTKRTSKENGRGFILEELAGLTGKESCLDGFAIHDYKAGRNTVFKLKLFENLGTVFLEECGSSTFSLWKEGAERDQAEKLSVYLYSSLLSRNTGVMPWCWSDFSILRKPYSYVPKETGFGIRDIAGKEKPSAFVYREFIDFVNDVKPYEYEMKSKIAVLLPRGAYDPDFNDNFSVDPEMLEKQCFEIFSLVSKAHHGCDIIREGDTLNGYELTILPDAKVSDEFLMKLDKFLSEGNSVLSFSPFGEKKASKVSADEFSIGTEVYQARIRGDFYLSEERGIAEVGGRPLLLEDESKGGKLFTLLCPFDRNLAKFGAVEGEEHEIINEVTRRAGVKKEIDVEDHRIDVGILGKDGKKLVLLVNQSRDGVKTVLKGGKKLKEWKGESYEGDIDVNIGPRGVKIFLEE